MEPELKPATQKLETKSSVAEPKTPDIQIPGYNILRELGHGGMAHVYLAVQESFGREVALKVLSPHLTDDEQFSKRFLREARIVSQLNHPNIVTVFDAGKYEKYHYMSMEYIPGQDLKQLKDSLSRKEALRIVKDVARALDFAGDKGIVHRDVKPENIMIHATDNRVILMDFGIAHGDDITHGMTQTGKAIGTPHFMSPEQTKGLKVDHRSDIYSLGIVLYQLLAGHLPFDASSAVAVGIKHLTAPIPLLPAGLDIFQPIINSCLSKQPEHRYQKASELITALDKISDAQLENIKTQATAFRQAGADHNARTQVGTAIINKNKTPELIFPSSNKKTVLEQSSVEIKASVKRRRNLLILLLLCTIAWAGYEKQEELTNLWGNKILPQVAKVFPDLFAKNYVEFWSKKTREENKKTIQTVVVPAVENKNTQASSETPEVTSTNTIQAEMTEPGKTSLQIQQPPIKKDRLSVLKDGLDENPGNAVELAAIYKDMLHQSGPNPVARQGLKDLREWYIQQVRLAIATKDTSLARQHIDMMKKSFPRFTQNKRFNRLQEKVAYLERLNSHFSKAEKYFNAGALSKPLGRNALDEIKTVLKIEPKNPEAIKFISRIADTYLDKTIQLQKQGNLQNALRMVEEGIGALKNNTALIKKRQHLKKIIQHNNQLASLLKQAKKYQTSGQLIKPQGRNAYDLYQEVLKKEQKNLHAKAGLKTIHQQLANKILTAINENRLAPAEIHLQEAVKRYGKTSLLVNAQLKLDEAIEARLPKIMIVRLSATPFKNLNPVQSNTGEQKETLQLKRTLYIGFNYKNFESSTTLLQATLLDGAGKVKIAQKPVIINSELGEQYFDINLPVDGFSDGSYKLELTLNNKMLNSQSFLVRAATPN